MLNSKSALEAAAFVLMTLLVLNVFGTVHAGANGTDAPSTQAGSQDSLSQALQWLEAQLNMTGWSQSATVTPRGINGTVSDAVTHNGMSGVTVSIGAASTSTDASGFYQILNVLPGPYTVAAGRVSGYSSVSKAATVSAGVTTTVDFALSPIVPDFSIDALPLTLVIMPGDSRNSTIIVTSVNGWTGSVNLSAANGPAPSVIPSGVTFSLLSPVIPRPISVDCGGPATSILTVNVPGNVTSGSSFYLNVTGMSGQLSHSIIIHVYMFSSGPFVVPEPNATIGILMMLSALAAFSFTRKHQLHLTRNR